MEWCFPDISSENLLINFFDPNCIYVIYLFNTKITNTEINLNVYCWQTRLLILLKKLYWQSRVYEKSSANWQLKKFIRFHWNFVNKFWQKQTFAEIPTILVIMCIFFEKPCSKCSFLHWWNIRCIAFDLIVTNNNNRWRLNRRRYEIIFSKYFEMRFL